MASTTYDSRNSHHNAMSPPHLEDGVVRRSRKILRPLRSPCRRDLYTPPGVIFKMCLYPSEEEDWLAKLSVISYPSQQGASSKAPSHHREKNAHPTLRSAVKPLPPAVPASDASAIAEKKTKDHDAHHSLSIAAKEAIKEKLKRAQSTVSTMAMPVSPPASSDEYDSEDDHQVPRRSSKDRQYRGPPIISRHTLLKKECGSCGTKKTPYWRDGWDKTVILCNACGIRYQKYRTRCLSCNYIARKDEKNMIDCVQCGSPMSV